MALYNQFFPLASLLQDALDTLFVKINEATVAESYGIEHRPSLVVFEKGIPNVYEGDLHDSDLGE